MHLPAALTLAVLVAPPMDGPADRLAPLAWPAGPLEVRIAYDEPIGEGLAGRAEGRSIPFRASASDAAEEPTGTIRIAGARPEDGGRTLVLLTDPHPAEASYAPELPEGLGRPVYDLSGVEASWTAAGEGEPAWVGWLPELELEASRRLAAASAEHGRAFAQMRAAGSLTLRTLINLPEGESTIALESDRPFEAELAFLPLEVGPDHRAEGVAEGFGEPVELFVTMPTGPDSGAGPPALRVAIRREGEAEGRPVSRSQLVLPWAPPPLAEADEPPPLPEPLRGGDPGRGEAVFFGEQGKCSACHRVGDRGETVGPDLSDIGDRLDPAAIHRSIDAPSVEIAPEYLPYTVAMTDGRVFVGVVRAEGAGAIRVLDADARAVTLPREGIEEIRPVTTSIMPVGLAGALGADDLRDLIAYLSGRRGE